MNKKNNMHNEVRISMRHITAYSAGSLLLISLIFTGGYFFGKKHMAEELVLKMEHDSFADQIYSSLCALYDQESIDASEAWAFQDENPNQEKMILDQEPIVEVTAPSYYAELIGYGTRKAADSFLHKLTQKGISAQVKERTSNTAGEGKKRTWYQVITSTFKNRENLEKIVDRVAREERIRGIRIVDC